jgi:hypothetical protein
MITSHYINGRQSDLRGIKPGWYAIDDNGKLSCGRFSNFEGCIAGITPPYGWYAGRDPLPRGC